MALNITVQTDIDEKLAKKMDTASTRAGQALAEVIAADTEPFVPARTLSLANRAKVKGDTIIYPGPYARYLYYGKVMVDAATGKGPMRIVSDDGTEVIRFRKGATLTPTDRPLNIRKDVHPQAQSHWLEGSKAQNLSKWLRAAKELTLDEIRK